MSGSLSQLLALQQLPIVPLLHELIVVGAVRPLNVGMVHVEGIAALPLKSRPVEVHKHGLPLALAGRQLFLAACNSVKTSMSKPCEGLREPNDGSFPEETKALEETTGKLREATIGA